MQLHQLLRYIHDNVPIIIFNLKGIQLCYVETKQDISINLYEYVVFEIDIGPAESYVRKSALYITIEK